jgi:hypothetical protein
MIIMMCWQHNDTSRYDAGISACVSIPGAEEDMPHLLIVLGEGMSICSNYTPKISRERLTEAVYSEVSFFRFFPVLLRSKNSFRSVRYIRYFPPRSIASNSPERIQLRTVSTCTRSCWAISSTVNGSSFCMERIPPLISHIVVSLLCVVNISWDNQIWLAYPLTFLCCFV